MVLRVWHALLVEAAALAAMTVSMVDYAASGAVSMALLHGAAAAGLLLALGFTVAGPVALLEKAGVPRGRALRAPVDAAYKWYTSTIHARVLAEMHVKAGDPVAAVQAARYGRRARQAWIRITEALRAGA